MTDTPEPALTRRQLIAGAAALSGLGGAGCVSSYGSDASYLTPVLRPENQNTVFHWADVAMQQVCNQRVAPPRAAYNFAMPMAAGFLAANGIVQAYDEPFGVGAGPRGADPEVAYGAAFAACAAEVFQQPFLVERNAFRARFPDGEARSLGVEWGHHVAMQIVKMRTDDGSEPSEAKYYLDRWERRSDSLRWTPTGPFHSARPTPAYKTFARPLFPGHGRIKPWTMTSSDQFRSEPFYDAASPEFAEDYELLLHLGGADSTMRTEDESQIALFWEDGPWGVTPPGHFLLIAIQVLQDRDLSFIELARAFALLGMTQCDASINAWDNKYYYDIVRPETAIRSRAPAFNNPDPRVRPQGGWRSYIPTPEFPSYTSGHSTFGAAGAEMTALLYGADDVSFAHESPDQVLWPQLYGARRSWTSLSGAAEENGMSRLYGGVHWRADHVAAMKAGRAIARQAFDKTFPRKA